MNRTGIEYLDYSWNPTAGCSGKGCAVRRDCWAAKMAKRLGRYCSTCPSFVPHVHFERFDEPLLLKKPSRIGVSFMGDFYDDGISGWVRSRVYMTMENAPQHTFIVLTKQPENIDEYLPQNLWVGVSVNRVEDLWRIGALKATDAVVKIVSFEPLLEDIASKCNYDTLNGIDWIIIGAQTRPEVQPQQKWVDRLVGVADSTGNYVAVFFKNNLKTSSPLRVEIPKEEKEKGCRR